MAAGLVPVAPYAGGDAVIVFAVMLWAFFTGHWFIGVSLLLSLALD